MKRNCVFIAALICLALTGCAYSWTESKPLAYSFEDVWETTYGVIARRYDIASASLDDKSIETNWKQHLSIMYLKGYRTRVYAEIEDYEAAEEQELKEGVDLGNMPQDDLEEQKSTNLNPIDVKREKKYILSLQVQKEQNRDTDNPSLPEEASWFPVGRDPQEEQRLLDFIMARLTFKKTLKTDEDESKKQYNEIGAES